jgi:Zinc finger, ZZ type/Zinc finger, C3HC4 type (RING finger)
VLFQPLTLLDCLHTFCGACLKEWFGFQASSAQSLHPYTCPSCRASVRGTKPNATVTTLLDMFLQANPDRGRNEQEKDEERKKYKPGDNVLPRLRRRRSAPQDDGDSRLLDEVRQLSLQEVGVSTSHLEEPRDRRRAERSRERRSRDASRDSRRSQQAPFQLRTASQDRTSGRSSREPSPRVPPARQGRLGHQASLRSLLSVSDLSSGDMEEEIMRQIVEEGLLDGIDLSNIDISQEDELSEIIAQAYRRRQEERRRERRAREITGHTGSRRAEGPLIPEEPASPQPRQDSVLAAETTVSRPPVSRPHLIDAVNQGQSHHRRSSSRGSSRSIPITRTTSEPTSAAVTAPEITTTEAPPANNNTPAEQRRQRLSQDQRRVTDPERAGGWQSRRPTGSSAPTTPQQSSFAINGGDQETATTSTVARQIRSPRVDPGTFPQLRPANRSSPTLVSSPSTTAVSSSAEPSLSASAKPTEPSLNAPAVGPRPTSSSASAADRPALFIEPSISCNRCGKAHIEYDLHYNCHRCENGQYNLCVRCYRIGKGCLHWYGFGSAAIQRYERSAPPEGYLPAHEPPHVLTGHCYRKPTLPLSSSSLGGSQRIMTEEDPTKRLQAGVFCDICQEFANACYWKCDVCNDGAWGYCNRCVNQGRHCTHPLLPLMHRRSASQASAGAQQLSVPSSPTAEQAAEPPSSPPLTPKSASILRGPGVITIANSMFRPLTFSTICDFCTYPIPPSRTRYHCQKCNNGDYDMCTSCYQSLVHRGGIAPENGHQGWRRCPSGHRMVIVGFEDRDGGQRRVVVNDLVGGVTLKEEEAFAETDGASQQHGQQQQDQLSWYWSGGDGKVHRQQGGHSRQAFVTPAQFTILNHKFPPDGGVGLRGIAKWGYFPADGVTDELMFPRGAEIREAEDINHDWFWGVYCGAKGLFPGGYVQVVGNSQAY